MNSMNTNLSEEKPINAKEEGLDAIWDIDEPSFDEALGTNTDPDPVLGGLDLDDKKSEEKPTEEKEEELPESIGADFDEEKVEEASKEEETPEEDSELPEFDPEVSTEDKKEEEAAEEEEVSEENEITTFAKMLAENELLDLEEGESANDVEALLEAFGKTLEGRVSEEVELFQKGLPLEGRELLKHMMDGGSVKDFKEVYSAPDFNRINISGENVNNQKYVIAEFLKLRGDSQEEIVETLSDYEDLGKLERQAQKAQQRLVQYDQHRKKELASKRAEEVKKKETQREEVLSNISNLVNDSADLKGFPLTRKAKKELLSYMTETNVKVEGPEGPQYVTQFQADEMKAAQNLEDFVLKAYLRMTDFNLDGVKKRSKSDLTSKLRTQLQNKKSMTGTQSKFGGNKKPGQVAKDSSNWQI
jgi:hypothetical protein